MARKKIVAPIAPSHGLPSWFDEEAMKALQDIYRSGALQEILAWWEARNRG
jgi:hypothetical protein